MPNWTQRALRHLGSGLLMGGADVVPGVSGGTMALIVGIYPRLIDSISHGAAVLGHAARLRASGVRTELSAIDWLLVLPVGLGIGTAIVAASAVLPSLLEAYPAQMRSLFFGLILASVVVPWRRISRHSWRTGAVLVVFALVAFLLAGLPESAVPQPKLWQVFLAAAVAICAMILPGVSGAFLLLVMGMYEPTLIAVRERDALYLVVFMAGAITGISVFSVVLRWLLTRREDLTMAALVGLMLGSLRALWPFQEDDRALRAPTEDDPWAAALILALVGLGAVLALLYVGRSADSQVEVSSGPASPSKLGDG